MNGLSGFASQHPFALLIGFWVFSNLVSTMPSPKSGGWTDGLGYAWLFNALHGLSGTIGRVLAQYPATQKLTGQQVIAPQAEEPPKP
jgi:hypothetical protein